MKWGQNSTWRSWNSQVHGAHHRIVIDAEGRAISDHISDNYLVPVRLFIDLSFIEIATTVLLEKYRDKESPSKFQPSPGFISDFKERNRFSSR
jgi:hypothetical protein